MAKIAFNGFGRIGRCVLRAAIRNGTFGNSFDVAAINTHSGPQVLAHLLKYDTMHGFQEGVSFEGENLVVQGRKIKCTAIEDPSAIPWSAMGVEVVIECTGKFNDFDKASGHLKAGARKVLLSAPGKGVEGTFVLGIDFDKYDKAKHNVVSMASCTTGSLAPVAKVLDESFGIRQGFMTTCHAYTMDQQVLDNSHKDLRRARTSALNIIPTTTGAAKAIGEVLPNLKGRMNGISLRVPVADGSITDLTVITEKATTVEEVNAALKDAAEGPLKGIMQFITDPIVSSDIVGNPHSSIVDGLSTMVMPGPDGKADRKSVV